MGYLRLKVVTAENEHKKHRSAGAVNDQPVNFRRLSASSTVRQNDELSSAMFQERVAPCSALVRATDFKPGLVEKMAAYKRLVGPAMLHRIEWIACKRAYDPHFDAFTRSAWNSWRVVWECLDDDSRAHYKTLDMIGRSLVERSRAVTLKQLTDAPLDSATNALAPWEAAAESALVLAIQEPVIVREVCSMIVAFGSPPTHG